jgi:hypothetical protein
MRPPIDPTRRSVATRAVSLRPGHPRDQTEIGELGVVEHPRPGEEPLALRDLDREPAAAAVDDVDRQVRVLPVLCGGCCLSVYLVAPPGLVRMRSEPGVVQ